MDLKSIKIGQILIPKFYGKSLTNFQIRTETLNDNQRGNKIVNTIKTLLYIGPCQIVREDNLHKRNKVFEQKYKNCVLW